MKKAIVFAAIMCIIFTACAFAQVPPEIIEKTKPAIVAIYSDNLLTNQRGNGFFIDSRGHILTNYHVVKRHPKLWAKMYNGKNFEVMRVFFSVKKDSAILRPAAPSEKDFIVPNLQFAKPSDLRAGISAVAIGTSPHGLWKEIQVKVIASNLINADVIGILGYDYSTALVSYCPHVFVGYSGSPLINESGRVIGMTTFSPEAKEPSCDRFAFAIALNELNVFLIMFESGESSEEDKFEYGSPFVIGPPDSKCHWVVTKEGQWCKHQNPQ